MPTQIIPLFEDGHILRREMLIALSDYAFLTNRLLHKGYADGILAGCELTTTGDEIILQTGILFFQGQAYLIKEPVATAYYPTNKAVILKISISDENKDQSFTYRQLDLHLTEQTHLQQNELELCRFTLQQGAELRDRYQNFEDRGTMFDTLNRIHVPYSVKRESTLSGDITRSFAEEMLALRQITDFDTLFCMQIMNQPYPASKDALIAYLRHVLKKELHDRSNQTIYQELVTVLRGRKSGTIEIDEVKTPVWSMSIN